MTLSTISLGNFEFTFKGSEESDQMVAEWDASSVDPISAFKVIQAIQGEEDRGSEED